MGECSICGRAGRVTKGLCDKHYQRLRTNGDPLKVHRHRGDRIAGFWDKVTESADGCWHWTGSLYRSGHGQFWNGSKVVRAHRHIYEWLIGPIPAGHDIDHICHNRAALRGECSGGDTCAHRRCVNPLHLRTATRRDNTLSSPLTQASIRHAARLSTKGPS